MTSCKERGGAPRARLRLEDLEGRVTPSWGSIPPSLVPVPSTPVAVALNSSGAATGSAAIIQGEVDWYRFTVARGSYLLKATTPISSVDPVLGLYDVAGRRVAYNDDVSSSNTDSLLAVSLAAGTYYVGITKYTGTANGSYSWYIGGPTANSPAPATFAITLRTSGLSASQQAIFQQAANRWAQVITGDLPNATYNGIPVDDVLIDASAVRIDGPGEVLGQAGPDLVRGGSYLPIHGVMEFDTADLARLEATGGLYYTVLHEMGHILGFGTVWEDRGLVYGAGTSNPLFLGPLATAVYNANFRTSSAGVPLENGGGEGTQDSHWRESLFGNEVMTGYLDGGINPLSRITLASLCDLGYSVNLAAGIRYTASGRTAVRSGGGTTGSAALRTAVPEPPAALTPTTGLSNGRWSEHSAAIPPVRGGRFANPDWFDSRSSRAAAIPKSPLPAVAIPLEIDPADSFDALTGVWVA